jgi:hypothetical protein
LPGNASRAFAEKGIAAAVCSQLCRAARLIVLALRPLDLLGGAVDAPAALAPRFLDQPGPVDVAASRRSARAWRMSSLWQPMKPPAPAGEQLPMPLRPT